jgi:DNA-binding MarR family transcriptional regulator
VALLVYGENARERMLGAFSHLAAGIDEKFVFSASLNVLHLIYDRKKSVTGTFSASSAQWRTQSQNKLYMTQIVETLRAARPSSLEERVKKLVQKRRIQDAFLTTVYLTVGLGIAVTMPNALQLLGKLHFAALTERNINRRLSQTITRLIKRGLLAREEKPDGSVRLALTEQGRVYTEKILAESALVVAKPKKWDGRWRVVIFDIWEKRKSARNRLRYMLQKVGFVHVQNSVWVFPYDCEELLVFIRAELKLGKSVLYLIADGMENDHHLRRHFNLRAE